MLSRLLLPLLGAASLHAQSDWPSWRGPLGTGVADGRVPVEFGPEENVAWSVRLPGRGASTPIVYQGRVFVTTATPLGVPDELDDEEHQGLTSQDHAFGVLCFDLIDGKPLWSRMLHQARPHERYHFEYGSYASPSPTTDGERLVVSFGSFGMYGLDLDGTQLWSFDPGTRAQTKGEFGEGASPLLHDGVVVQVYDHLLQSRVVGLDASTGEVLWSRDREEDTNWSTPIVYRQEERVQALVVGSHSVQGYDLRDGSSGWIAEGPGYGMIPVPVIHERLVIAMGGYAQASIRAFMPYPPRDQGPSECHQEWCTTRGVPYTSSPILHEGRLYTVKDLGRVSCFDAATGQPFYMDKPLPRGTEVMASPVLVDDRIYIPTTGGKVHVLATGSVFELLHTSELTNTAFLSSPAVSGNRLLLRDLKRLYCITDPAQQ